MKTREELIKTPEYWFETIQNEIYRQLAEYMEVNNISRTKLAEEMKVSKGYITQILNGDFNCSLRKLIELSLFIDKAPVVEFKSIESVIQEYNAKVEIPYNAIIDKRATSATVQSAAAVNSNISIAYSVFAKVTEEEKKDKAA